MNRALEYLNTFALLDWVNIALALGCAWIAGKLAIKLAHNPNTEDLTETVIRFRDSGLRLWPAIRVALRSAENRALLCGLVTIFVAALGYVAGQFLSRWQPSFDLLAWGGLFALMLASRRQIEARAAQSLMVTAGIWILFFSTVQRIAT